MAQCPACDQPLLSCIRNHHQYLFCTHCRGEMAHFTPLNPVADSATMDLSDRWVAEAVGPKPVDAPIRPRSAGAVGR